jgi:hypothetical protein
MSAMSGQPANKVYNTKIDNTKWGETMNAMSGPPANKVHNAKIDNEPPNQARKDKATSHNIG